MTKGERVKKVRKSLGLSLESGEGKMFVREKRTSVIYEDSPEEINSFRENLFSALDGLDDEGWQALKSIFDSVGNKKKG